MCRDGNAVITESNWVVLCPPTDDVSSQAAVPVPGEPPELLPSEEIGMYKNHIVCVHAQLQVFYMFSY